MCAVGGGEVTSRSRERKAKHQVIEASGLNQEEKEHGT